MYQASSLPPNWNGLTQRQSCQNFTDHLLLTNKPTQVAEHLYDQ